MSNTVKQPRVAPKNAHAARQKHRLDLAISTTVKAGMRHYDRARHLPALIGIDPGVLSGAGAMPKTAILARLKRALRAERQRAKAGHWAYDLNRHIALRQALIAEGLETTLASLTDDWGADWAEWTYGRGNPSGLSHMFIPDFDLPAVERPGGFGTINATGANFRRIMDLADLDRSVATNAPGQSAQPGSPFYGDLADFLGNGEYFPFLFTRGAIEEVVAHRLMLQPGE